MDGISLGSSYTWSSARAAGVTRRQVERDGRRIGQGLYLSAAAEPTLHERCRAWARILPPGAAFGGATAAVLAGAPLPEPGRREARHEELVAAFGLDRPVVIRGDAGWSVRIERQLVVPPAVAWERLVAAPLEVANVLVSLRDGTGHGARLVVAVNGAGEEELQAATAWVRAAVARAAAG